MNKWFLIQLGVIGTLATVTTHSASAESNQFFESNAVDNFTVPVVSKEGVGYQFFIDTQAKQKEIDELHKEEPAPAAPQAVVEHKAPEAVVSDADLKSGEQILAHYGDPNQDVPVLAQENAPKPFKAMMAAFEAGDDQLAYGYARQWVRYMDHLKQRTSRVVEAAQAAQASEKIAAGNNPEANRLKQMIVNDNAHLAANIDPRAQEILAKAQADEAALKGQKELPKNDPEAQEIKMRKELRSKFIGKVPVDPKGKVDVYLFFAPGDENAKNFAPVANMLYKRFSVAKNVNFAGFSTARLNADALLRQRQQLGLSFKLMVGDGFAKELKLNKFPAVILVSPTTGKVLKETGDKPFIFFDELISVMQGRVE